MTTQVLPAMPVVGVKVKSELKEGVLTHSKYRGIETCYVKLGYSKVGWVIQPFDCVEGLSCFMDLRFRGAVIHEVEITGQNPSSVFARPTSYSRS